MSAQFPPPKSTSLTADILRSAELEDLEMRVVAGESGFGRPISWGRIQRPGLALAGFLPYIKPGRIQILGESELNYLDTMAEDVRRERIASICALPVAAFVITKGQTPPDDIVRECRLREIPLLVSDRTTSVVIQSITRVLEDSLAPVDHAPRRARRRLRNGRAPARRVRHRKERVRAGPRAPRPPAGRRRRGRDPPLPERGARRARRRDDPLPHGAARNRHHQHQAPLRRLGGAGLQVGRARHRAAALGPDQEVRPARPGRRDLHDPGARAAAACGCRSPPAATSRC